MINYIIPGFYELKNLNLCFLEIKKMHPEYFYDDFKISSVYGNPQFCIWDGGRIFKKYIHSTKEEIENLIKEYHEYDVKIRYVFTNSALTPDLYNDRFCNLLLELGSIFKNNEIVSNNDEFTLFLKEKYRSYNFISSTTKCLQDLNLVREELNKDIYIMSCLDYNLNNNITFLKTLSNKEKEKVEFLINAICPLNCPVRKDHYYFNSLSHLNYAKGYDMQHCGIKEIGVHPEVRKNHITYQDIKNIYEPMNFSYFKIEGRTLPPSEVLCSYCHYMVKPEYHDWIFTEVMNRLYESD